MQRWYFLSGDVNWREYGAKWYTRLGKGEYKVLEFINFEDATGEKYTPREEPGKFTYVAEVKEICFEWYSQEEIDAALECSDIKGNYIRPLIQLEAMHSYGHGDVHWTGWGNNAYKLVKKAKNM